LLLQWGCRCYEVWYHVLSWYYALPWLTYPDVLDRYVTDAPSPWCWSNDPSTICRLHRIQRVCCILLVSSVLGRPWPVGGMLSHFIQDLTSFIYSCEFFIQNLIKTFSEYNWGLVGLTFGHEAQHHGCWQMDVLLQNHHCLHHHCNSCCLKVNYLYMDTDSFHCNNQNTKLIVNSTTQILYSCINITVRHFSGDNPHHTWA
jgi:hypothetical protein